MSFIFLSSFSRFGIVFIRCDVVDSFLNRFLSRSILVYRWISSESLYEDENFKHRELAALVSSKVYYHLGSLDNALTYALGAVRLFDVNDKTEYVETIIA